MHFVIKFLYEICILTCLTFGSFSPKPVRVRFVIFLACLDQGFFGPDRLARNPLGLARLTALMISTGHNFIFLIYLDKYQLGFTFSYVRVLGSRTLHTYQSFSCLEWHNNARMIISLAWFHNLFSWDLCHFRGNWLKQTVLKYYATDSLRVIPYFLSFIYRDLIRFECS